MIFYVLLIAGIISVSNSTVIVHLKNETSVNYIFFKAVYVPTSPNPFNITGRLYVMQTMDVEELRALDLEGVIVLGSRVNFTNDVFSQAVYEGKGLVIPLLWMIPSWTDKIQGYIAQSPQLIVSSSRVYPVPFLSVIYEVIGRWLEVLNWLFY